MTGLVRNQTYAEELPVVWLYPKSWNGRVAVWLDERGKAGLYDSQGGVKPAVMQLVDSGATVLGADLVYQGEFLPDATPVTQQRTVTNPREAPAYTFGYNDPLFAQRTHDVVTLVKYLRTASVEGHPRPSSVVMAGFGDMGPVVAAARAVTNNAIDRAAVDTGGFRFHRLLDYRDPQFLPGGAKYFDVPGLLALGGPQAVWLAGESDELPLVASAYRAASAEHKLTVFRGAEGEKQTAVAQWLLEE
jgi:hypothetical protein